MSATIVSELRKITSTRLWWILLLIMAVTIASFAGFFGLALVFGGEMDGQGGGPPLDATEMASTVYSLGVTLGYVFPMTMGALLVTNEFRHRTIDTTVLAQPHRAKVIVAKFVAATPLALLYGVVGAAATVGTGAVVFLIGGEPTGLDQADIWQSIGMSVVAMATWMLVGVGFGSVFTNQVVVIVSLLAWTQFVEPIARVALGFVEWGTSLAKFLPGAAGEAMIGSSFYSTSGIGALLPPWGGFALLLGYGVVAAAAGWLTTFRHDIT